MANYVTNTTHEFDKAFVSQIRSEVSKQNQEDMLSETVI